MAALPKMSNLPGPLGNITIHNLPIAVTHPGLVLWVDSNSGVAGAKGNFNRPLTTLAAAIALCRANKGDIIFVKPGHTETLSSATALLLNIAGIAIVGLGIGSNRPKFTLDTANTATIAVSKDNISILNCQFVANFLSIAACFTLSTAKYFTLQGCTFADTSSALNFLNIVKSTGAANTVDGLTAVDCRWNGLGTTSVNSFILSANDIDGAEWSRNHIKLARTATAAILATITAGILTNLICRDNVAISQQTAETGGGLINVGGTTSTGLVKDNLQGTLTTATDIIVTGTTGFTFDGNKKTGVISASGFLLPAADS